MRLMERLSLFISAFLVLFVPADEAGIMAGAAQRDITPPVGLNLIVAMTAFKEDFLLICRAVLPFISLMLAVLILVVFIPELSLFLIR